MRTYRVWVEPKEYPEDVKGMDALAYLEQLIVVAINYQDAINIVAQVRDAKYCNISCDQEFELKRGMIL